MKVFQKISSMAIFLSVIVLSLVFMESASAACTDSDPSDWEGTRGILEGHLNWDHDTYKTVYDVCVNGQLKQYDCSGEGYIIVGPIADCSSGRVCYNGRCIPYDAVSTSSSSQFPNKTYISVSTSTTTVDKTSSCKLCSTTGNSLGNATNVFVVGGKISASCSSPYPQTDSTGSCWIDAICWGSSGYWQNVSTATNSKVVNCCVDSDCGGSDPCKTYTCDSSNTCSEANEPNGTVCDTGKMCYSGSCLDPDESSGLCSGYVSWTCDSPYCMDQDEGYSECNQGDFSCGTSYDVDKINSWPNGSQNCCGDDSGEQPLRSSWCNDGSCNAGDTYFSTCNCQRPDSSTYSIGPVRYSKNCCAPGQCAWHDNCFDPDIVPADAECWDWCSKIGTADTSWYGKSCTADNTTCSNNYCICESSFSDCDSNGSCECDLSTSTCSAGVCTVPTYSCTGTTPADSTICTDDDIGLSADTAKILVSTCTADKCEYTCDSGFTLTGGVCVAIPNTYSCTGTTPADSTICTDDDIGLSADTAKTLVSTCTADKCEYTCNTGFTRLGGSCVASCTDTCSSLGYTCGTQTICGVSVSCGAACPTGVEEDCGIRMFDGTDIVIPACEAVGSTTSPLRIGKNGIPRGIVLIDPTTSGATHFRIQTANDGVKAIKGFGGSAICGNGIVDSGEECDDGNTIDGDGCSSACLMGYVYSGSSDDSVKAIDRLGNEVWTFNGHTNSINGVAADGQYVYSGDSSGVLKKLDLSGDEIWSINTSQGSINCISVDSNGNTFTAGSDSTVRKFNSNGSLQWTFSGHSSNVNIIYVSSSGYAYTGSDDNTVKKIDTNGNEVWSYNQGADVEAIYADSSGNVYAGDTATRLRKLDSSQNELWTNTDHTGLVSHIVTDSSGNVYSGSYDDTVRKFNSDGNLQWTFTGHTGVTDTIDIDLAGNIYTASWDNTVKKIDADGNEVWTFSGHTNDVNSVAVGISPTVPSAICGNSIIEGSEECDDGNITSGDGCSSTCAAEAYVVCGDGAKAASEECDDGNTTSGDGCSATCTIESIVSHDSYSCDGGDVYWYDSDGTREDMKDDCSYYYCSSNVYDTFCDTNDNVKEIYKLYVGGCSSGSCVINLQMGGCGGSVIQYCPTTCSNDSCD